MTRTTILAFTAIALLAGAAWLLPARPIAQTSSRPTAAASLIDLHVNAHLENLPVQDVEDQTFVFPQTAQR